MGELVSPATDALLSPNNFIEKYQLTGNDDVIRFTAGRNVVLNIEESEEPRDRDSSKAHTQLISEYKWERREFGGNLLSVHENLIAYQILSETNECVRVIQRETKQRQLIKGFRGRISDISWAPHTPLLAVVDEKCNLYVYQVNDSCVVTKYVNVMWDNGAITGAPPRIFWCNYVPEEGEDDDELNMLAIAQANLVHVIDLSAVRAAHNEECIEIEFSTLNTIDSALNTFSMDEEVAYACLAPDGSVVSIALTDKTVQFYSLEDGRNGGTANPIDHQDLRMANTWVPELSGHQVSQLLFLDSDVMKEQFWRWCVAIGAGGRRMSLYECEGWKCVGRLRFDSANQGSAFTVHRTQCGKFLVVVDNDGANVFNIEIDYSQAQPRFCAVTQVTFCHPLVAAIPYDITEKEQQTLDNSFEDDDDEGNEGPKVIVHLIGINFRNIVQLDLTLDKTATEQPYHIQCDTVDMGTTDVCNLGAVAGTSSSGLLQLSMSNQLASIPMDDIKNKLDDLHAQIERLTLRADRADEERRQAATNQDIVNLLVQFKEEYSLREDRLMANISDLIEANRNETIAVVRNALNENSLAVENSIQANHKISTEALNHRVAEKTRDAIVQNVVPTLERLCSHLFQKLNESYRNGLDEFLEQMRILSTVTVVSATPAPLESERAHFLQQLKALIQTGNIASAFEMALNLAEEESVLFVCNNVNPEELFQNPSCLSQAILLPLLQQISMRLDNDTDIKFRYMELALATLSSTAPCDSTVAHHLPTVLSRVITELKDFQSRTADVNIRRQARMIYQVAVNMIGLLSA